MGSILAIAAALAGPSDRSADKIISELGHPQFLIREAATCDLLMACHQVDGIAVIGQVVAATRTHPDSEVRTRARWIASQCCVIPTPPIAPWIDSLPYDYCGREHIIKRYVDAATSQGWPSYQWGGTAGQGVEWAAYCEATRLWVRDWDRVALIVPVVAGNVERLLGEMQRNHAKRWYLSGGATKDRPANYPGR